MQNSPLTAPENDLLKTLQSPLKIVFGLSIHPDHEGRSLEQEQLLAGWSLEEKGLAKVHRASLKGWAGDEYDPEYLITPTWAGLMHNLS
ncbi:MAG TPA: hypothetical protein PLO23_01745 [Alphaproteobacteria bacterium]|nr:hypothetical protein [Alphaproteobacteria bacterium]